MFAWGFGGANLPELKQLASDPSKAVLGTNLTDLASYLEPLQAAVCAVPPPSLPPPSPPPPCGKYVTTKGGVAFSQECPPPSPPSPPPHYCATPLDFVLVLDESGSMYNVMADQLLGEGLEPADPLHHPRH